MKPTPLALLLCGAFSAFPLCSAIAAPAPASSTTPAVTVDRALAIANRSLTQRHQESHVYIESIALVKPTVFSQKRTWFVKWSHPIPGSRPEVREIGLSVAMDGRVVHVVK